MATHGTAQLVGLRAVRRNNQWYGAPKPPPTIQLLLYARLVWLVMKKTKKTINTKKRDGVGRFECECGTFSRREQ